MLATTTSCGESDLRGRHDDEVGAGGQRHAGPASSPSPPRRRWWAGPARAGRQAAPPDRRWPSDRPSTVRRPGRRAESDQPQRPELEEVAGNEVSTVRATIGSRRPAGQGPVGHGEVAPQRGAHPAVQLGLPEAQVGGDRQQGERDGQEVGQSGGGEAGDPATEQRTRDQCDALGEPDPAEALFEPALPPVSSSTVS